MGRVDDSLSVTELALPATHNSATARPAHFPPHALAAFLPGPLARAPGVSRAALAVAKGIARCQDTTVREQLEMGIRGLDLRVGLWEGEVRACHAVVCDVSLRQALLDVRGFLESDGAAGEVVVVTVKRDWDHRAFDKSPDNWERVREIIASTLSAHLAKSPAALALPLAHLRTTRQRAIVLVEHPPTVRPQIALPLSPHTHAKTWREDTKTPAHMLSRFEEWHATGMTVPQRGQLRFLEVALPGRPRALARVATPAMRRWVEGKGEGLRIGVLLDFPDEEVVRWVVAHNPPKPVA